MVTDFKVSPNPTTGALVIDFKVSRETELIISDLTGKVVMRKQLNKEDERMDLNISDIPDGVYILSLKEKENGNILYTEKVIKI